MLDRLTDKVWVHLRDPRECVVSAYFHYKGIGHGEGDTGADRVRDAIAQAEFLGIECNGLDEFAEQHIGFFINWITAWLHFDACFKQRVFFTYFEEVKDTESMFRLLFEEYQIDRPVGVISDRSAHDRRRESSSTKELLSPATYDRITEMAYKALKPFEFHGLARLMNE